MNRFEDKVVIVTGAGQGIGETTAKLFASEGAKVAVFDLNQERAHEVVNEIIENGGQGLAITCDVTNNEQVEKGVEKVASQFGKIDILVNNAGITRDNLLFKMSVEDWDLVMDTHLKGSFLCSRAAQKYMVAQKYGKIIMMSSRSALGNRGQTNYSAAKAGLQGMTRTMAIELGPFGINVNAVAPGFIDTDMTRAISQKSGMSFEEIKENVIKLNAIKRVGTMMDVAAAVAFFASDESGYITGQVLYITGRPSA